MSRNLIIGVVVALVVVGSGTAYYLSSNKEVDTGSTNQQSANLSNDQNTIFEPVSTSDTDFTAIITTTDGDKTYTAKMQSDKDSGNISYSSVINGQESLTVYTSDAYYFCQTADKCIKYPLNQIGDSSFDPESYKYSDEELSSYKNNSTYQGKRDCPSGTCDVWTIKDSSYEATLYVDGTTKRIVKVEGSTPTGSSSVVYDYGEVTVTVPASAQEIPNVQL